MALCRMLLLLRLANRNETGQRRQGGMRVVVLIVVVVMDVMVRLLRCIIAGALAGHRRRSGGGRVQWWGSPALAAYVDTHPGDKSEVVRDGGGFGVVVLGWVVCDE